MNEAIPPHNLEAERAVLGCLLLEGVSALERVGLEPVEFYQEGHRAIYAAMRALADRGEAVTLLTVQAELRELGQLELAGGPAHLALCEEEASIEAGLASYVAIVRREHARREGQVVCLRAMEELAGPNGRGPARPVLAIAADLSDALARVAERVDPEAARESAQRTPPFVPIREVLERTTVNLALDVPDLIPSPIAYLNDCFGGGFRRRELVLFGGAAGMGKTAFMTACARHAAARAQGGHRVGIISLEMGNEDLGERFLAQTGPVSATALRKHDLDRSDWDRIDRAVPELAGLPIEFADEVVHVHQIGRMLRRRQERGEPPFRLLIVDYLQLLDAPRAQARYQEVGFVAKLLKRYAKRYDLTVLALSSFTPDPAGAGKKPRRPTMRNLRESRDLDHAADIILLLWRPDADLELIIDKGRGGRTGAVRLQFTGQYLTFEELA